MIASTSLLKVRRANALDCLSSRSMTKLFYRTSGAFSETNTHASLLTPNPGNPSLQTFTRQFTSKWWPSEHFGSGLFLTELYSGYENQISGFLVNSDVATFTSSCTVQCLFQSRTACGYNALAHTTFKICFDRDLLNLIFLRRTLFARDFKQHTLSTIVGFGSHVDPSPNILHKPLTFSSFDQLFIIFIEFVCCWCLVWDMITFNSTRSFHSVSTVLMVSHIIHPLFAHVRETALWLWFWRSQRIPASCSWVIPEAIMPRVYSLDIDCESPTAWICRLSSICKASIASNGRAPSSSATDDLSSVWLWLMSHCGHPW